MRIYGVAIIAISMLLGIVTGDLLGYLIGIDASIGGIGFAMIYLLFMINELKKKKKISQESLQGIVFWKEMYLPVVVAMTATQNVAQAISEGMLAILSGVFAVVLSAFAVKLMCQCERKVEKMRGEKK